MKFKKTLVIIRAFLLTLAFSFTSNNSIVSFALSSVPAQVTFVEQTATEQAAEILEQEFRKLIKQGVINCEDRENPCTKGYFYKALTNRGNYRPAIDYLLNSLEGKWTYSYSYADSFFRVAQYADLREYEEGKSRALANAERILNRLISQTTTDIDSILPIEREVIEEPQGCRGGWWSFSCRFGGGRINTSYEIKPLEIPLHIQNIRNTIKLLELLQQVYVLQGRDNPLDANRVRNVPATSPLATALTTAEYNRSLALDLQIAQNYLDAFNPYALDIHNLNEDEEERLRDVFKNFPEYRNRLRSIQEIQNVAERENATLVFYSLVSHKTLNSNHFLDSRLSYKNVTLPADQLYIWVINPISGQVSFVDQSRKLQEFKETFKTLSNIECALPNDCRPISGVGMDEGVRLLRGALQVTNRGELSNNQLQLSTEQKAEQDEQLANLYELLIEPIKDFLPRNPRRKVMILPQGALSFLPFAALKDPSSTNQEYLIQQHTILTAPNIRTLILSHQNQSRENSRDRNALIVGNPLPLPDNLDPLPGAEEEAEAIKAFLKKQGFDDIDLFKRNEAIPDQVIDKMADARIIHFATHGIVDIPYEEPDLIEKILAYFQEEIQAGKTPKIFSNDEWPELERIWNNNYNALNYRYSSFASGSIALSDNFLSAFQVFMITLRDTDLVVLSACNTGIGPLVPGGVIGLPYSFSAAGASNIIMSLWTVPDRQTADLMEKFYDSWLNEIGTDKAHALQRAMLDMIEIYPDDPRYWAAFTLVGSAE